MVYETASKSIVNLTSEQHSIISDCLDKCRSVLRSRFGVDDINYQHQKQSSLWELPDNVFLMIVDQLHHAEDFNNLMTCSRHAFHRVKYHRLFFNLVIKKSDSNFNFNNSYDNNSNSKSNDFIIENNQNSLHHNNYTEANFPIANNINNNNYNNNFLGNHKSSNIINNNLLINNV